MIEQESANPTKLAAELRLLVKKVFTEPEIIQQSLDITRELFDKEDAPRLIAEKISSKTNIKIPFDPSEADKMFVGLLIEIIKDEKALY